MITRRLPNAEFLPFVLSELNAHKGRTANIPLRGRSMRPFLEDGRDEAWIIKADGVKVGDVVLAEVTPGRYVFHRIIEIDGYCVTLRGDGNLGTETCLINDVKAKALGFFRKGSTHLDATNHWKWRIYSWWWTKLYPIRRYLLFILYPHWPHFLSIKKHENKERI